ncbi:MAG: glycoside hydrolase family 9 protein, partial [Verrucomicrobiota bacterium]
IYGEAFYVSTRGMYHQRGSIELSREHTAWSRPKPKNPIYRGGYISEAQFWYDPRLKYANENKDDPLAGFRFQDGKPMGLKHFTMIHSTRTEDVLPGMESGGGWHDAADYDRRIYHYKCVWDLCGIYELFPSKFTDGQLNIPESGNGIPDVLDEAAIQIDFFLKTQAADGGVSSWAEQVSHPQKSPWEDEEPFYLSLPDRLSSLQFAACAAYLGRMIRPFDAARAKRYLGAASRAYEFGANPANRLQGITFTVSDEIIYDRELKGEVLTFNEAALLPYRKPETLNIHQLNSLIQLAVAGSKEHRASLNDVDIVGNLLAHYPDGHQRHPFMAVTPVLAAESVGLTEEQRSALLSRIESLSVEHHHGGQDELAYRHLFKKPSEGWYVPSLSWGGSHVGRNAYFPLILYRATGEESWRQRVLFGLDWQFGCNAVGRTFTSGLGSVSPLVLQHKHSSEDSILEPVPGITT